MDKNGEFMKLSTLIYGSLSVALALISLPTMAKEVPCPQVELVQKSIDKIDTIVLVDKNKGEYHVYSGEEFFAENSNLLWSLGSIPVENAPDFNTAFAIGLTNVKNAYKLKDMNAQEYRYGYLCTYLDKSGNFTAATFSEKHDNGMTNFKKAIMNLR